MHWVAISFFCLLLPLLGHSDLIFWFYMEGDVRTVMSVESSHEMAVEAPWLRSRGVAGVECHLHLALPVRLRLAADLPNSRSVIFRQWRITK